MDPTYTERPLPTVNRILNSEELWAHLGVNTPQQLSRWNARLTLQSDRYLSAEFTLSQDNTILIADHLSNTTQRQLHMSQLIQRFLQQRGLQQVNISWLIISNIKNQQTASVVERLINYVGGEFAIYYQESTEYNDMMDTPFGKMAEHALAQPAPQAISVGSVGQLPSMTFWVTNPPPPSTAPAGPGPAGPGPTGPTPNPPPEQQGGCGCCIIM
jgi:hypothetical protein